MDARPKTRQVHRQRTASAPQPPRGAKQIVIPMTRSQYDDLWHQAGRVRAYLAEWAEAAPADQLQSGCLNRSPIRSIIERPESLEGRKHPIGEIENLAVGMILGREPNPSREQSES